MWLDGREFVDCFGVFVRNRAGDVTHFATIAETVNGKQHLIGICACPVGVVVASHAVQFEDIARDLGI